MNSNVSHACAAQETNRRNDYVLSAADRRPVDHTPAGRLYKNIDYLIYYLFDLEKTEFLLQNKVDQDISVFYRSMKIYQFFNRSRIRFIFT